MSERQRQIYQTDGDRYEALIAREDYQGNIEKALDEIVKVDGLDVFDLGAETGRLAWISRSSLSATTYCMIEEHHFSI